MNSANIKRKENHLRLIEANIDLLKNICVDSKKPRWNYLDLQHQKIVSTWRENKMYSDVTSSVDIFRTIIDYYQNYLTTKK